MSNAVENKKTRKKNVKKYKERDDLIEKREEEVSFLVFQCQLFVITLLIVLKI